MSLFILIALVITAIALLIMLRPLSKTRNTISFERQAQNIHFAKERLAELDGQLKNASISATDYEALKLEIESTLADDIDLSESYQAAPSKISDRSNKVLIGLLICLLPITALSSYYWWLGTPTALTTVVAQNQVDTQDVDAMVASVEARLEENPDDAQGWTILSRTYLALGRHQDAKNGFLKLMKLEGESADVLASLADASALMAGGDMSGEPTSYIERALALEPKHAQSLWLAGLSAAQQGNSSRARLYWNQLLPLLEQSPQQQLELREIIQQTFANEIDVPGKADDSEQTNAQEQVTKTIGLTIDVRLSNELNAEVSPQDLVFVFARAKQGPPAPLAVKRLTVADLPAMVTLSDSDAMMAQLKLSLFDDVVVSARVAKSGNPVAQAGDFQSASVDTKNANPDLIKLTISEQIK